MHFFHGDLVETVYMRHPPGFYLSQPGLVCHFRKSLYFLKKAPRCWFANLGYALREYGFVQYYTDYSLFTLHQESVQLNVIVYVDDLIIVGNNIGVIQEFKSYLSACFHMKDPCVLKYFLGIDVS